MEAKELLTSPLAGVTTLLTSIAHVLGYLDPIIGAVWMTVGTWYPALAISSSTIVPILGTVDVPLIGAVNLPWLAQNATIIGALIYVAYLGDKTIDRFSENTE